MKKLLSVLLVLLSIIVSGCGEESDAIKVLKDATEKNYKLAQMQDKTAVEYARELGATIYQTTCKISKFDQKYAEEENKLILERDKIKLEATMKMLDLGGKNIFDLPKAKEDALKAINEAEQRILDYQNKHKDYVAAVKNYKKSISAVITTNNKTLSKKNDVIDGWISSMVVDLAKKNNYKDNIDFSKIDTYKYGWTKPNARLAEERTTEDPINPNISNYESGINEPVAITNNQTPVDNGYVNGVDVNLRKAPSMNADVIRTLDHDNISVIEYVKDASGQEWARVRLLNDGTEGYIAKQYFKHSEAGYKKDTEQSIGRGHIVGTNVIMRNGASREADPIGEFKNNEALEILKYENMPNGEQWVKIRRSNGDKGFVFAKYFQKD